MTIDEAIEQFKYDADCNRADLDISYAEENEQVAEWLEELKSYRASVFSGYMTQKMLKEEYNKAIDDFVEKIELKYLGVHPDDLYERYYPREICKQVKELAEQLKVGGKNDNLRK